MEIVALIPARGGSKGIPGKNLAACAGRPLIAWTLDAAHASSLVERVVVSTDSAEIAAEARTHGAEVLDRPPELADGDTPMLDVIRHALVHLGSLDVLVVLQPTSPLRRAEHVDGALRVLLEDDRADVVVSVVEVPHQFRPGKLLALEDGRLVALGADPLHRDTPPVYARNGPAVVVLRPERLGDELYGGEVRPYLMSALDSVDVDGPDDLRLAEALLVSFGPR
jgi:CMP-N,N'-diacetyllegionaminic acid synthase